MSLSGQTNTYLPPTLDGLNIIEADEIYINGVPIDTQTFVPYLGATKDVSLGNFSFETLSQIRASEHVLSPFESTMMTGPTASSIFIADSWSIKNSIEISSLGSGSFLSTSYLRIADTTNTSTLLTLQSDGIANFANTRVRVSTMASNNYDVVNLSTLTNAVAFIDNVNALNYVPYQNARETLNMGGSTIQTTGLINAGALRITSSISNDNYSLSVNSLNQLEIRNLTTDNALVTGGDSLAILNINAGGLITTGDIQIAGNSYLYGSGTEWRQTALSDDYEIKDDVGDTRLRLSKTTGLTISTLNVTQVPSATPTLALGVNGSGGVVSFAVPSAGGTVNTSTLTARFLPYLSTGTTLTNSLLNQIDNDSMGFGYTAIPNYPLGSGGKNMYVNGSIFAGGLNSMVGTFGRNTTTGNQNEITFTASGVGTLLAQIKSHSGPSALVDATWTYSNTNPAPLGANQGQVLLTADKMTMSLTNGLVVNGVVSVGNRLLGTADASPTGNFWIGLKGSGSEGDRLAISLVGNQATGAVSQITLNKDVVAVNNLTANCLIVNGGGTYQAGCIYSDANWGMLFRAKVVPAQAIFGWYDSAGAERMRIQTGGQLLLSPPADGPGFVHTSSGVIVESYIGGAGGWFGTRSNHPLRFYTNNSSARMTLNIGGDMTHTAGDSSYMKYGPNATWNANLVVGASPDRSGAGTAQVITTNGNLHLDAGNSNSMYYGYYANARGTPNTHQFFGDNYQFNGVAQNYDRYAQVCVFVGNQMRRSQCMMNRVYVNETVAWGGGINMTYAFYKYNAQCPVRISGKYSMYSTYVGTQFVGVRIYSQTAGTYLYYYLQTYQNIAYAQTTYPLDIIVNETALGAFSTGWFDIYIYNAGGVSTDANNQLWVNVQVLPVDSF